MGWFDLLHSNVILLNCTAKTSVPSEEEEESVTNYSSLLEQTPSTVDISKYSRLLALGVSKEQIVLKMKMEGVDPALLDGQARRYDRQLPPELLEGVKSFDAHRLKASSVA